MPAQSAEPVSEQVLGLQEPCSSSGSVDHGPWQSLTRGVHARRRSGGWRHGGSVPALGAQTLLRVVWGDFFQAGRGKRIPGTGGGDARSLLMTAVGVVKEGGQAPDGGPCSLECPT